MKGARVQGSLFSPPARRRRLGNQVELTDQCFALVDRAIVGDMVTLLGVHNQVTRSRGRYFCAPRCSSAETVMLGCFSCRQPIANLTQLLWHLEDAPDQRHVIARQCGEHGWEAL